MQIFKSNDNFGVKIEGLKINGKPAPYPVFNEREIRAGAGLMFVVGFATMMYTVLTRDFGPIYWIIPFFFIDFAIKVFQGPGWSPFGYVGKILVSNQRPEWVGAVQKRFAWMIGLIMAFLMIFIVLVFEIRGLLPLSLCGICLTFMWMESSLGLCVGCKIYAWLLKFGIIPESDVRPACAGGVCEIGPKK